MVSGGEGYVGGLRGGLPVIESRDHGFEDGNRFVKAGGVQ